MTSLVTVLSTGKGTWSDVSSVMSASDWDNVFVVTHSFAQEKFSHTKEFNTIILGDVCSVEAYSETIRHALQDKIMDTEVAIHMISGTGLEHTAVLSAVLSLGLGVRLVGVKDGKLIVY